MTRFDALNASLPRCTLPLLMPDCTGAVNEMMAPHHERERMLWGAIRRATSELAEPIESVRVSRNKVTCWGRTKKVCMTFSYADAYSAQGEALLGGGSWHYDDVRVKNVALLPRLWWR